MKLKLITCILTASAIFALSSSQAATPKKGESKAEDTKSAAGEKTDAKKRDTYPLYGKVVSITSKTLTIKGGEGKEDRKYSINADTVFVNGEKPAKASDVKEGAWIGGLLKKVEGDANNDLVVKVNIGVKQKEEGAAKDDAKGDSKSSKKKKS